MKKLRVLALMHDYMVPPDDISGHDLATVKWKTEFDEEELNVFDYVASETLCFHGYEVKQNLRPVSSFQTIIYRLTDRFKYLIHMFRMNVIDGIKIKFFGKQPFDQ